MGDARNGGNGEYKDIDTRREDSSGLQSDWHSDERESKWTLPSACFRSNNYRERRPLLYNGADGVQARVYASFGEGVCSSL
jgi:hypothetical protein